jgi:hypothetical protein
MSIQIYFEIKQIIISDKKKLLVFADCDLLKFA